MTEQPRSQEAAPCAECRHSRADHPAGPCRYFMFPMNCHCRAFAEQPRSQEAALREALDRFLDADAAVDAFDEQSQVNFAETGERGDDERGEALWRERALALAALHDFHSTEGIFGRAALAATPPEDDKP